MEQERGERRALSLGREAGNNAGRGALIGRIGEASAAQTLIKVVQNAKLHETILVNRSHARWIDLNAATVDDDGELIGERPKVYHAAAPKGLTRTR